MERVMDAAPWPTRRAPSASVIVVAAAFAAVTAAAIAGLDAPIARAIAGCEPSSVWNDVLGVLEYTLLLPLDAVALPIVLVIGMLVTVGVKRFRYQAPAWMFVTGAHLVSRLTTNWIK